MYKLIKNLFAPKEKKTVLSLRFESLPEWLEERKNDAHTRLMSETGTPVRNIRNAMAKLQHIVNGIDGAEQDEALHPKLKSIAKKSLPLFIRAMNASLSKELPDDIEEFYSAAVECVKGCLSASQGQGRYLQAVFPGEMKDVKTGIDAIGHEINAMTAALTAYRSQMALMSAIKTLYDALCDISVDFNKSIEKERRIKARIDEITQRTNAIDAEILHFSTTEQMREVTLKKAALRALETRRDDAARSYAALTMTASHVLRKAEKIALKQQHPQEMSVIRSAMGLLSDHSVPGNKELMSALSSACPIAQRMIENGEITLKNKEERAVFSDINRFCSGMGTICAELKGLEEEYKKASQELASHPLIIKTESLAREKTQIDSMLEKEKHAQNDLAQWEAKIKEKIPVLKEDLKQKIERMIGETVQLQIDDHMLA